MQRVQISMITMLMSITRDNKMRVVETTIQIRKNVYITFREGQRITLHINNRNDITGNIVSFCIDGNSLEYIVLEHGEFQRILVFGKDIIDISKEGL